MAAERVWNLKHREKLLQGISECLMALRGTNAQLCSIELTFHVGDLEHTFSVARALDYVVNDVYFDETGNWSEADNVTYEVV